MSAARTLQIYELSQDELVNWQNNWRINTNTISEKITVPNFICQQNNPINLKSKSRSHHSSKSKFYFADF